MRNMQPEITNVFSIGYRCNTDELLKGLKIRKFSGPFSYMVCDLQTALQFVSEKFANFTDVVLHGLAEHKYTWNGANWRHDLFFNRKFVPVSNDVAIDTVEKMCCWNHHDLGDSTVLETIQRRYTRMLDCLNSQENALLIHVAQLQLFNRLSQQKAYYDEEYVMRFLAERETVHMCILIPLLNYPIPTTLCKVNEQLNLIYYKSNRLGNINDFGAPGVDWYGIMQIISNNYTFK